MVLLVGLGNPDKEYEFTRHNAGKMFARYLAEHPIEGLEAVETECFMNESGGWLQRELQKRGITSSTGTTGREVSQVAQVPQVPQAGKPNETRVTRGTFGTSGTSGTSLLIAHDDLDIPLGTFKIQFGKGPRQHKGILSIEGALGTTEFWRVRIGIDARKKIEENRDKGKKIETREEGEEYVLSEFSRDELRKLNDVFTSTRATLVQLLGPDSSVSKIL